MIERRKKQGLVTFQCLPGCGECCTPIPFPEPFFTKNEKRIVNTPHHLDAVDMGDGVIKVLPITENFRCCFLHPETKKCAIYHARPEVCKQYGRTLRLPCKYVRPDGIKRTPMEVEEWGGGKSAGTLTKMPSRNRNFSALRQRLLEHGRTRRCAHEQTRPTPGTLRA